jgi:ABC-type nitrate/sulfonate/bicarbonate transport system substrate-binding protein
VRNATRLAWAVGILAVVLAAAACGSSSSNSTSSSAGGSSASSATSTATASAASAPSTIHLTFAESVPTPAAPQVELANGLGIFKQVGLTVTPLYVGANIADEVVSGRAQIGNLGAAGIVSLAQAGKPTTAIWASLGNAIAGMLVTRAGIPSLAALQSMKSCKLAGLTPGTSNYGWGAHYIETLGLHCTHVEYNSDPAIVGACVSGQADACTGLAPEYAPLQAAGKVHILIDTRSAADRAKYIGPSFSDVVYWGMSSWLKANPVAAERFVKAMYLTDQALHTDPVSKLAAVLHQNPNFKTLSLSALESFLADCSAYYNTPDHGYISEQNWNTGLKDEASWGIKGFNPAAQISSYAARVDMSYYDKAAGGPPPQ